MPFDKSGDRGGAQQDLGSECALSLSVMMWVPGRRLALSLSDAPMRGCLPFDVLLLAGPILVAFSGRS